MEYSRFTAAASPEHDLHEEMVAQETRVRELVVFNDDVNTFDHVIQALIDVCDHTPEQAEQCTIMVHYKGQCAVKSGDLDELAPMRNDICRRGISAEVI